MRVCHTVQIVAMPAQYLYDVALSFAGEQRLEAERIATLLKANGIRVFYDNDQTPVLWGRDLATELARIYEHEARYCLMLISKAYAEKMWTKHERKSALARALAQDDEYILPVRFDATMLGGIPPHDVRWCSTVRLARLASIHGYRISAARVWAPSA